MAALKRHTVLMACVLSLVLASLVFLHSSSARAAGDEAGAASESPFPEGDPEAIEAGQALYVGDLGCAGCHGQDGGGGMGPALNDGTWDYGGEAADIYETLVQGRPNGMPAFSDAATDEQLWQVTAFVQSLSSTE